MAGIIYYIENLINGKIYIGSTAKPFKKRKYNHFYQLKKNIHGNKHLQSSYNKYGKDSFKCGVICECLNEKDLSTRLKKLSKSVRHNSVIQHTDIFGNEVAQYDCLDDAEQKTGFKKAYTRRVCNKHRNHHKGNVFEYVNR